MWENIIGIVNEERGTNAGVEALINAPQRGGGPGRKAEKEARRAAAAEAVLATGGFDTAITSYNELLSLAKSQGAMGDGATRGACKVCGQLGHLTKQCRNQFSKFFQGEGGDAEAAPGGVPPGPADSDSSLSGLSRSSDSDSSSDSEAERRRRKHKEKKRKRDRKEKKRHHKESRDRRQKKESKHKSSKKRHKSRSRNRSRSPRRERRH